MTHFPLILWAQTLSFQSSDPFKVLSPPSVAPPAKGTAGTAASNTFLPPAFYTGDLKSDGSERAWLTSKYPKKHHSYDSFSSVSLEIKFVFLLFEILNELIQVEDLSAEPLYSNDDYSSEFSGFHGNNNYKDAIHGVFGFTKDSQYKVRSPSFTTSKKPYISGIASIKPKSNSYAVVEDFSVGKHFLEPTMSTSLQPTVSASAATGTFAKMKRNNKNHHGPRIYDPEDIQLFSAARSALPSFGVDDYNGYSLEDDTDYSYKEAAKRRLKAGLKDQFKGVASQKQIDKYLEDQEKLLDQALKLQLLNSPRIQKLLKLVEKEQLYDKDRDLDDDYFSSVPPPFRHGGVNGGHSKGPHKFERTRRRPPVNGKFKGHSSKHRPVVVAPTRSRRHRQAIVIGM